jgi:hypothetical protein
MRVNEIVVHEPNPCGRGVSGASQGENRKLVLTPLRLLLFTAALLTTTNLAMGWYYAFDFPIYLRSFFFSSLSTVRFALHTVIVAVIALGLSAGILAGRWSNEHRPVVWFIFISVFPLLIMSYGIIYESLGLNENNVFVEHPHRLTVCTSQSSHGRRSAMATSRRQVSAEWLSASRC